MTAKEVTINYLKSIQKDLDGAISKSKQTCDVELSLMEDYFVTRRAIKIVEESEGE